MLTLLTILDMVLLAYAAVTQQPVYLIFVYLIGCWIIIQRKGYKK